MEMGGLQLADLECNINRLEIVGHVAQLNSTVNDIAGQVMS